MLPPYLKLPLQTHRHSTQVYILYFSHFRSEDFLTDVREDGTPCLVRKLTDLASLQYTTCSHFPLPTEMGVLSAVQRIYRRVRACTAVMYTRHISRQLLTELHCALQQPEPDYETILSSLDTKVKARENHLLAIKLRERRANALFITYGLGLWALYSILWYALLLHRRHGLQGLLVALPVFIGPVL